MKYVLFHDSACVACSDIANTLHGFPELSEVAHSSLSGEDYANVRASIPRGDFPALVRLADGKRWSRNRLVLKLGSMVSPRHWAIAARLFARSRAVQAQGAGRVTRRTVLGGLAAGAIASTIGIHETAAAAPRTVAVVDPVVKKKILAAVESRSAEWGKPEAVEYVSSGVPMFVVQHNKNRFSFVPESDQTLVLGMAVDVDTRKLTYYLPGSSTEGVSVVAKNGQTQVLTSDTPSGVQAKSVKGKLKCFALCIGEEAIDLACFNSCVTGAVLPCTLCAGQKGIVCAIKSRKC